MVKQEQDIRLLRQRLAQSNIIVDATRRFAATLNLAEVRQALFEAAFQVVGSQQIALHIYGSAGWQSEVCYPLEGNRVETAVLPPQATTLQIFTQNEPFFWQRNENSGDTLVVVKPVGSFDSYVALPLKGAKKVVGVIEVFNLLTPENAVQQAELLTEITGPASLAISNAQLYQETRIAEKQLAKRATELEIVSKVSVYASTILETEKLLQEVVDLAKEQFDLYHAHIYLLNATGDTLNLAVGAGEVGRKMASAKRAIPIAKEQSLVARAARLRAGVIENNVRDNPAFLPNPLLPDTNAEMAVPMLVGETLLGVLDVQSDELEPFTQESIHVYTTLAAQLGVAVQNARSFEQMEDAVRNLNKLTQRLTREGWQDYLAERPADLTFSYDAQMATDNNLPTAVSPKIPPQISHTLQIQGASIGQLQLDAPNQYSDDATDIVTAVAERLSAHLENLRLAESSETARANAERRSGELALINRMMSSVTASFDLTANMKIIAQELSKAIEVSHVGIALLTTDENYLEVITEHPEPTDDVIGTLIPVKGNPLTEQAIATKQFAVAYDAQNNPLTAPIHDLMRQRGVYTLAVVPMIVGDEFFGTVGFDLTDPNRKIDEQQMRLAETIVYQAATVVQNARLFTQTKERAEELAVLNRISHIVSQQIDSDQLLETVYQQVQRVVPVDAFIVGLYDSDTNVISFPIMYDLGKRYDEQPTELTTTGRMSQVIRTGKVVLLNRTPEEVKSIEAKQHKNITQLGDVQRVSASLLYVPMLVGQKTVGLLSVQSYTHNAYNDGHAALLQGVAGHVVIALENVRLFAQTRQRADRERLLNKIVTQVAASLDLQHSLQIIVDEMATALNVDQVRVALIQPDGKEMFIIAEHFDPKTPSAVGMKIPLEGNLLTQEVINTRKMIVVEDAQNSELTAPVHALFREQGIETVVILPLVVNDEVLGTIGLDILDDRSFDHDTLQLAETIVYQAAVAIQNAQLFEKSQAALAETETLYAYTSQLNSATNLDAVLDSAAAPGFQVGATDALLLVYDQDTSGKVGTGRFLASSPKHIVPVGETLSLREQPFSRFWPASGKNILFVGDVSEDNRLSAKDKRNFLENGTHALAIMFLSVGNLRIGQIIIRWQNKQTFTAVDERLYGAIAQQASSVVYNRLLFNQTEEALSETVTLYQASSDINTAQTYDGILKALRQYTLLGQGSHVVTISFFDRPWDKDAMPDAVSSLASWSASDADNVQPLWFRIDSLPGFREFIANEEMLIHGDIATDDRLGSEFRNVLIKEMNARAIIYVPLTIGSMRVGYINGFYRKPVSFSDEQIRRLNVLVNQAAVTIESLQLMEQTRRRADREALINSINQKIQSAPTIQFALQTAVTELSQALKLKTAAIELSSEKSQNGNGRSKNQNGS